MNRKINISACILLFIMAWLPSMAQQKPTVPDFPVDPDTKKIMYREVVEEKGSPAYLYNKSIEWFGYYYLNPQSVYSIQDKENGKIEGQGRLKLTYMDESAGVNRDGGIVSYQIRIELKEDKYRYTLTDFNLKGTSRFPIEKWLNKSDPAYNANWDLYLYQVDTTMQRLITSIKERMKPTVIKKDEW